MDQLKEWRIRLPDHIKLSLIQYGASQPDQEVCGLLAGYFIDEFGDDLVLDIEVAEFIPIANIAPDPLGLFVMEPNLQLKYMKYAHDQGMAIVGCFHSHPHNLGIPSSIDAAMINEDFCWLIWGGQDNKLRAWHPVDYKDPALGFEEAELI